MPSTGLMHSHWGRVNNNFQQKPAKTGEQQIAMCYIRAGFNPALFFLKIPCQNSLKKFTFETITQRQIRSSGKFHRYDKINDRLRSLCTGGTWYFGAGRS